MSVGVFCSSLVRLSSLFLLSLKSNGVCSENARVECTHGASRTDCLWLSAAHSGCWNKVWEKDKGEGEFCGEC